MAIEYMGLQDIQGPLAIIDGVRGASYDDDAGQRRKAVRQSYGNLG